MIDPRLGPEGTKARNRRSIAIGLVLAAFVALVFVTTMVRLAQNAQAGAGRPAVVPGSDRDS